MDRTVDPCTDFFEYACGNWNKVNVIPDDRATYNTFAKLRDDIQVLLKGVYTTGDDSDRARCAVVVVVNLFL